MVIQGDLDTQQAQDHIPDIKEHPGTQGMDIKEYQDMQGMDLRGAHGMEVMDTRATLDLADLDIILRDLPDLAGKKYTIRPELFAIRPLI